MTNIHHSRFRYNNTYDSNDIYGIQDPRPWNITEEIKKRLSKNELLVDVGCGTAKKIIPLKNYAKKIIGLDINNKLLKIARVNIKSAKTKNITLIHGDYRCLPFPKASIDMLTFMLAPDDANEAFRVLKPGGYVVIERTGERDKKNIKNYFGLDSKGKPRGYRSDMPVNGVSKAYKKIYNDAGFTKVDCVNGFWRTFYSINGLKMLLETTPLISNYNENKDRVSFNKVVKELKRKKGLKQLNTEF